MGFSGMPAGRSPRRLCKAELWSCQPGRIIPALLGHGSQGSFPAAAHGRCEGWSWSSRWDLHSLGALLHPTKGAVDKGPGKDDLLF